MIFFAAHAGGIENVLDKGLPQSARPVSDAANSKGGIVKKNGTWSFRGCWRKVGVQSALIAGVFTIAAAIITGWCATHRKGSSENPKAVDEFHSPPDEAEMKRIVKEAQLHELAQYKNPETFERHSLSKYFLQPEEGGKAFDAIEASIARLLNRGWRYGKEAKADAFDFRDVRLSPSGEFGEVRTRERWYIPLYRQDGERVLERNVYVGPFDVDYTLRKLNGKWRIQSTSAPYARGS
jgi:hypothetical protein